jgi:hypothetical protein
MDANDASPYPYNVSSIEYWDVTRNSGGNAKVTLYWADSDVSYIDDCTSDTDLIVAHFTSSEWRNANNSGTATITGTCSSSSGTITSDLQTSFSPFTFGSESEGLNPLPIDLISFTAKTNGNVVDLNWETASEINNDYFTIERSEDAIDFEPVATVGGAGNSTSTLNYSIIDFDPLLGVSYYRLKQTDFDGAFEYSAIEAVNFTGKSEGDPSILIVPNPVHGDKSINVLITNFPKNSEVSISMFDLYGKSIYSKTLYTDSKGIALDVIITDRGLKSGIYYVNVYAGDVYVSEGIVVLRR